jgi:hypothetical protein
MMTLPTLNDHKDSLVLASALNELPRTLALVPKLVAKIEFLESKFEKLEAQNHTGWVVIAKAAEAVGLTLAALRQKKERDPLPEGIVWKQTGKGGRLYFHVENLKEYL